MQSLILLVAILSLTAIVGCGGQTASKKSELPLRLVATVPLPGDANRFDYMSLDGRAELLYIAHMDAGTILVLDTKTRRVRKMIAAPGVHGVIAVPGLQRVYATATDDRQLFTIDS